MKQEGEFRPLQPITKRSYPNSLREADNTHLEMVILEPFEEIRFPCDSWKSFLHIYMTSIMSRHEELWGLTRAEKIVLEATAMYFHWHYLVYSYKTNRKTCARLLSCTICLRYSKDTGYHWHENRNDEFSPLIWSTPIWPPAFCSQNSSRPDCAAKAYILVCSLATQPPNPMKT